MMNYADHFDKELNYFNKLVLELNDTSDLSDNEKEELLKDISSLSKHLVRIMQDSRKEYWIGVYDDGPDDNFVRCYIPLGLFSESEALEKINHIFEADNAESYEEPGVMSVDEDTYKKYLDLADYTKALQLIKWSRTRCSSDTLNEIEKIVISLREELGLSRRWEQVFRSRHLT